MIIDRRTFVVGAALAVVAPIPRLPARSSRRHDPGASRVAFMIDGWSAQSDEETVDQVWISVDRGWRTSWL